MFRRIALLTLLIAGLAAPAAFAWTDRPLTSTTPIRKIHLDEIRAAIDAARAAAGLAPFTWTDPVITAGQTQIRAVHITEMRAAISQVYVARGWPAPTFVDPVLDPGTTQVRTVHFEELRDKTTNAPTGPVLACSCTAWAQGSCGGGSCAGDEMQMTRTCSPDGCNTTVEDCVVDPACSAPPPDPACSCTSWVEVGGCGAGGCGGLDEPEVRTCTPAGCNNETRCDYSSACEPPCDCDSWTTQGCGGGTCPDTKERQTRNCNPSGCDSESRCLANFVCESGGGGGGGSTCDDLPVWASENSTGNCQLYDTPCDIPPGWTEDPECAP